MRTVLRADEARPASSTASSRSSSPTLKPNRSAVRKLRLTSSGSARYGQPAVQHLGARKHPADQAVSVHRGLEGEEAGPGAIRQLDHDVGEAESRTGEHERCCLHLVENPVGPLIRRAFAATDGDLGVRSPMRGIDRRRCSTDVRRRWPPWPRRRRPRSPPPAARSRLAAAASPNEAGAGVQPNPYPYHHRRRPRPLRTGCLAPPFVVVPSPPRSTAWSLRASPRPQPGWRPRRRSRRDRAAFLPRVSRLEIPRRNHAWRRAVGGRKVSATASAMSQP